MPMVGKNVEVETKFVGENEKYPENFGELKQNTRRVSKKLTA